MKKYKWFFVLMLAALLLACGGGGTDSPVDHEPVADADTLDLSNVLSLGFQQALKKEAYNCPNAADSVDVDLGCLLRSGNYYFVLNNNTDFELTDIVIESSNPAFAATPEKITSIGIGDKSTGIVPLLRLAVSHGTELNDMSTPDALPSGTAKTELTISGKVDGKDFSQSYVVGGYAKTMEAVRRDGVLYLEGPMYFNGTLTESVRIYEDVEKCNGTSEFLCASSITFANGETGFALPTYQIECTAPLASYLRDTGNGIVVAKSSAIIDK